MRNFFKHEPLPVRSLLKFAQSSLAVDNIVTAMSAIIGALDLMVGNTFKPKQRKSIAEQLQNVRIELLAKLKAGDQEALRKDPVLKPLFQSLCAKLSSDDEVKKLLEAWLAPEDLARAVETTTSEEGASSGASSAHQSPSLAACDTGAILAGLASGPASKPDHSPVPKSSEERAVSKCMPLFRPKYYFTQTPMPATFFFGSAFIAPFPEIPDPLRPGQFLGGSRDGGTPFQKPLDPNAPVFVPGKRV